MRLKYKLYRKYPTARLGMNLHRRIGLIYLPGALPCFEDFGNLPTDLVCSDALIDGEPASEILDMLIIPGGSLVESGSINKKVSKEILKMASDGKFVLGICSGFQILAKATDIGRLSTTPITREGLGLLDAEFTPLICTDRMSATITGKSFITGEIGKEVSGFHCHTYGQITLGKDARTILVSHAKHVNYFQGPQDLISGVSNKDGNVVGVFLHGLLDHNPIIIDGITNSLGLDTNDLKAVRSANAELLQRIKSEVGIATSIQQQTAAKLEQPRLLMVTATASGSGKTFVVTGLAGALKKRGLKIGVLKVGGDIRDAVPALYLTKEPVKPYSSIKVARSGWKPIAEAVREATQDYDFVLVEGAMSAFTGLLNDTLARPTSTAEVAAQLNAPTVIVVACDQDGIEGAVVNTLNYVSVLRSLGVRISGVILNKVHVSYLTDKTKQIVDQAFENIGVKLLGILPRLDMAHRGMIPEVEIRYEDFGAQALAAVEQHIDLDALVNIAQPPALKQVDYALFGEKFKTLLANYRLNASEGGKTENC